MKKPEPCDASKTLKLTVSKNIITRRITCENNPNFIETGIHAVYTPRPDSMDDSLHRYLDSMESFIRGECWPEAGQHRAIQGGVMNSTQFSKHIMWINDKLIYLSKTKGAEYAGNDNTFANFERLSESLGLTREQVLMVYLTKHLDGINNWVKTRKEFSEPIEGRIEDAILYLTLLHAMVTESKNDNNGSGKDLVR